METNKFIKLHQFNNNTPIVINVDSIVLVQQDEDDKSTCITLETENVDDVYVHESVDKIFDMMENHRCGVNKKHQTSN